MGAMNIENDDNVTMGGGAMSGFGGWGIILFLFLLFIVFNGNGSFGGNRAYAAEAIGCHGTSSCQIDKDVIESKYQNEMLTQKMAYENEQITLANADRVIADAHARNAVIDERALTDTKMENYFLRGQLADNCQLNPIREQLAYLTNNIALRPPVYAQSYVPNGCEVPCGGRDHYC